ncbi:hypothetical protein L6164_000564 [Bauhinia variegata]|uniref:Uncharacterized protein n=1 Tax=Bauhinia variegata TaxID=167791 RepID=A0ACB9Q6B7_BAUVA|nr:hypothetical protein L6164_000564 [Bauhinia variegata]
MSLNPFSHSSRRHESTPYYGQRRDLFHQEPEYRGAVTRPEYREALTSSPGNHLSHKNESSARVNVKVDWKETPEMHEFKVHLPGLRRDEVKVEVEGDRVVCITGERMEEREEQNGKWTHVELTKGTFVQRLTLPENANPNHVKAYMENGVLTLTVPKHEVARNYYARPVSIYGN